MTRRRALAVVGLVVAVGGLVVTVASARAPTAAPTLDGHALFVAKGCSSCHVGPDSTSPTGAGPPLADAAEWAGTRRPGVGAETYLAESMRDPGRFVSPVLVGTAEMPRLALTDDEIDRLVGYLLER